MSSKDIQRLGGPLVSIICAYRESGVAEKIIICMQNKKEEWSKKGFNGVDFRLLEGGDKPSGLLLESMHPKGHKFSPKFLEKGNGILVVPVHNSHCVEKRAKEIAGCIFHAVWRGAQWRDRAGNIHNNPY